MLTVIHICTSLVTKAYKTSIERHTMGHGNWMGIAILLGFPGFGTEVVRGQPNKCVNNSDWNPAQCFEVTPHGNLLIEVGHSLELNCSVRPEYRVSLASLSVFTAHNLTFQGAELIERNNLLVHEDEMTLQLNIPEARVQTQLYRCFYQNILVSGTLVDVKKVPKPENIQCVSYNFDNMTCFFTVEQGDHIAPMKWAIYYKFNEPTFKATECIVLARPPDIYNMQCSLESFLPFLRLTGFIKGIWNSAGNSTEQAPSTNSSEFSVLADYSIVRTQAVRDMNVTSFNTNATLGWKFPQGLTNNKIIFKIRLVSVWDNRTFYHSAQINKNGVRFTITDLVPYTWYSASVRCRLSVTQDISLYWSDFMSLVFNTSQDAPYTPVIIEGFMYIDECALTSLCVVIYWKNPEDRWSNGPLIGYLILINTTHQQRVNQSEINGRHAVYPVYTQLSSNQAYHLQMKVKTEIGYSKLSTPIIIPDFQTGVTVQPQWVLVEVDADIGKVLVTWHAKPDRCASIVNITYYRCTVQNWENNMTATVINTTSLINCKEDLEWRNESVLDGCVNITYQWDYTGSVSDTRYAVAITTLDGISGGIVWEKYRYQNKKVPDKPIYTAQPMIGLEGSDALKDLNVTILYPSYYSSDWGRPEAYKVLYKVWQQDQASACPQDGTNVKFPVNYSYHDLMLKGLSVGSQYVVCVQAENHVGFSRFGEPVIVKLEEENKTTIIVAVTVSVVLGITGLIIIIICVVRRMKKMGKHVLVDTQDFEKYAAKTQLWKNSYINQGATHREDIFEDSGRGQSITTNGGLYCIKETESISSDASVPLPGYNRLPISSDTSHHDWDSISSNQSSQSPKTSSGPVCSAMTSMTISEGPFYLETPSVNDSFNAAGNKSFDEADLTKDAVKKCSKTIEDDALIIAVSALNADIVNATYGGGDSGKIDNNVRTKEERLPVIKLDNSTPETELGLAMKVGNCPISTNVYNTDCTFTGNQQGVNGYQDKGSVEDGQFCSVVLFGDQTEIISPDKTDDLLDQVEDSNEMEQEDGEELDGYSRNADFSSFAAGSENGSSLPSIHSLSCEEDEDKSNLVGYETCCLQDTNSSSLIQLGDPVPELKDFSTQNMQENHSSNSYSKAFTDIYAN